MRSLMATTMVALAGFSVSVANAEDFGRGLSINPGGGYYSFDKELRIDDESFPAIGVEYRFTDHLSAELHYINSDTLEQNNIFANFDIEQIRLDGHFYFQPYQKLQPYLSAGAGQFSLTQVEKQIEQTDTIAALGGGIRYFFNQYLSVRTDLRAFNNLDSGYTDSAVNVSLNLLFGGNSISRSGDIDLVKTAPPVTVAALNPDMDGDGVLDVNDDCLETAAGLMVDENGCAIPIESTVSMDLNVNFEFESAELPPEFYSDVKELATFLKLYRDSVVTIEGHADATGPQSFNQGLSERRAKAIRNILVRDFEIEKERLKIVGYGENLPIADNSTEEGRQKNRRAATVVTATRATPDAGAISGPDQPVAE